jgi:UDP-glucose 4-epimerase
VKIIISGGSGFIGRKITDLLSKHHEITVISRKNFQSKKNIKYIQSDICNFDILKESFVNRSYDLFLHLAWEGSTGKDRLNTEIQNKNINSSINCFKISEMTGCTKFVGVGSISEFIYLNKKNKHKIAPNVIYGYFKNQCYKSLRKESINSDVKLIWTRLSNVYSNSSYQKNLLGMIIKSIENNKPITISECKHPYDFIFLDDAVKALSLILLKSNSFNNYTISNNEKIQLCDYLSYVNDLTSPNSFIKFDASLNDGICWD